jgi:hypothetical protein
MLRFRSLFHGIIFDLSLSAHQATPRRQTAFVHSSA